jgi:hypothetical protein
MCKLPCGDRHVSFPVEQAVIPITHPGKGKYMSEKNDTCTVLMNELISWFDARNIDVETYLKEPKGLIKKDDDADKQKELREDVLFAAADRIVTDHLIKDEEFTAIMNRFCNLKARKSKVTHTSAIREVLRKYRSGDLKQRRRSANAVKAELVSV